MNIHDLSSSSNPIVPESNAHSQNKTVQTYVRASTKDIFNTLTDEQKVVYLRQLSLIYDDSRIVLNIIKELVK